MSRRSVLLAAAVTLLPAIAVAQPTVYCFPGTVACFSAELGFVPTSILSNHQNRLIVRIVNLKQAGDPEFGFRGFFFQVPNGPDDPFSTGGWIHPPTLVGSVQVNSYTGTHVFFDQPTGVDGFWYWLGSAGIVGCGYSGHPDLWVYSTCADAGYGGSVQWDIDLRYSHFLTGDRPATYDDFALIAYTTAGSCVLSPSAWYGGTPCVAVTPEPATLLLVSSAIAGMGTVALRRGRKQRRL